MKETKLPQSVFEISPVVAPFAWIEQENSTKPAAGC